MTPEGRSKAQSEIINLPVGDKICFFYRFIPQASQANKGQDGSLNYFDNSFESSFLLTDKRRNIYIYIYKRVLINYDLTVKLLRIMIK